MFDKIIIIGLGLIGGSIARSCKSKKVSTSIYAYNTNKNNLEWALKNNIIDGIYDFKQKISVNDLVIIATPLLKYKEILQKIFPNLSKDTIVIDVGSVKSFIEDDILSDYKILKDNFISCHPIAGSEKSGVQNSESELFKDNKLFIIKDRKVDEKNINKISLFWQKLGSKIEFITANKHDKAYALISHLPQLISFKFKSETFFKIENTLIKKHLRLQSSNQKMWEDIFSLNKKNIDYYFDIFTNNLDNFKDNLKNKEDQNIVSILDVIDLSLINEQKFNDHDENIDFILSRILLVSSLVLIKDINVYKNYQGSGFKDFTLILKYLKYLLANKILFKDLLNKHRNFLLDILDVKN